MGRLSSWSSGRTVVAVLIVAFVTAGIGGSVVAVQLFTGEDVPDVSQLEDYRASTITRLLSDRSEPFAEFAEERRIPVRWDEIPKSLRDAVVAVEDAEFFEHSGVSLRGILRAAVVNAKSGRMSQGGSSVTQQLAKVLFLSPERSFRRKIKEAILAVNIERSYSKEEIFTLYCNQIYLGHGRYGVEAASQLYFGKHVWELDTAEAALIAGLPQAPEGHSPIRHPASALERRNHVLDRMAAEGMLSSADAETAKAEPLGVVVKSSSAASLDNGDEAGYFREEVRQFLEQKFGARGIYHDGLSVHTTLDTGLQVAAERAVRDGLLALDARHGWRGAKQNLVKLQEDLETWSSPAWRRAPRVGDLIPGVVMTAGGGKIEVRVDDHQALVTEAPEWTGKRRASDLLRRGDVGLFRVVAVKPRLALEIVQEPEAEAALVAIDVKTGAVKALVGGWSFERSRFDRAVQAQRQTGSAFKAILYAAAMAHGVTPADVLFDEPIELTDEHTGVVYSPENHGGEYHGLTTVRAALEQSRNPLAVQLLQRVGAEEVIAVARRLGIQARLEPYPSLALGVFEVSLLEMTAAYAALADHGTAHRPYFVSRVEDRDGKLLYRGDPISQPAVDPDVAFVTTHMLEGVIEHGTGRRARSLGAALAGKTGTTDGYTDAWFIGYSPSLAVGVWVGHDQKVGLGEHEEGARAALPIWIDFMATALAGKPEEKFAAPSGVEFVRIDRDTGLLAGDHCAEVIVEAFRRGTAPVQYCSPRDHEVLALPYFLQKVYVAELHGLPGPASSETPTPTP